MGACDWIGKETEGDDEYTCPQRRSPAYVCEKCNGTRYEKATKRVAGQRYTVYGQKSDATALACNPGSGKSHVKIDCEDLQFRSLSGDSTECQWLDIARPENMKELVELLEFWQELDVDTKKDIQTTLLEGTRRRRLINRLAASVARGSA